MALVVDSLRFLRNLNSTFNYNLFSEDTYTKVDEFAGHDVVVRVMDTSDVVKQFACILI